jgi:hypothetical protein
MIRVLRRDGYTEPFFLVGAIGLTEIDIIVLDQPKRKLWFRHGRTEADVIYCEGQALIHSP